MNADMYKPPVAPKPKIVQRSGQSPATSRKNVLALPSPGTQRKAKPALAPKPCLPKPTSAVESKPLASKRLRQTSATEHPQCVGPLKLQNGIQQENKKPDWDYVIPICLCSQTNCNCVTNTSSHTSNREKELKTLHKGKTEESRRLLPTSHVDNNDKRTEVAESQVVSSNPPPKVCPQPASITTQLQKHKRPKEKPSLHKNLTDVDTSRPLVKVGPCLPNRTVSKEANGNVISQSVPGRGQEEDPLDPQHIYCLPNPKPVPRKPCCAPVPRKPRAAFQAHQEKVEAEKEKPVTHKGGEMNTRETKVPPEGKSSSPPSVSVPASNNKLSARTAGAPPAPPPEKKPFLSAPDKAPTSAPQDVEEEDLGWDGSIYEMEVSVDEEDTELEKEEGNDQEAVYYNLTHSPVSSRSLTRLKLRQPPANTVAAEEHRPVKVAPEKPQRRSSSMARIQRKESSEERGEQFDNEKRQDCALKEVVMKELPPRPDEKKSKNLVAARVTNPSRSSLGKQKAKSFSSADIVRSEGQRRNSFRKLLDLKLTVAHLMVKGGQRPESPESGDKKRADRGAEERTGVRKCWSPLMGVEQSVDDDLFSPREENIYEVIPDYVNVEVGKAGPSPGAGHTDEYNDEGIYEEQEPYMPFEKYTEHQHYQAQAAHDRKPVTEEVLPVDDGPSDDNITFNSSDEEFDDDSSSVSSKGESEQTEGSTAQDGQKRSKVYYIAREVMTSESVFVDVLKMLHVDFRDAVAKASHQSGKPVIEERLLNQILYYLPQLYELNQDLLRELTERLANWDKNSQLADIFLKKGPFLKMYSTYIREFDKNVALLVDQSKRNPAFGAVVHGFEASPCCANLALKHYLLKPIQRIPQYQLLLTDYLKNLSEDSVDYKDTQAALALVKEVANHANDIMKQGDDFQKLMQVQCSLSGHQEIVQPGRILLKEGPLMKLSRKIMQPRMFFLFNDVLLYTTPVQSGQYKLNNMLSLGGMKVSKPSLEASQNELNIVSVERSFILSASSATERDEWLEAISTAIADYTKKTISFISGKLPEEVELTDCNDGAPLGSKAPIWIPDTRATMCMICTCEFTLTWRRHHCRACGKVVCNSCSTNKHRLEYLKNELARVCDQCSVVLLQQRNESSPTETISPGNRATFGFPRKQKRIPAALKEVSANTDNSSMSGYLQRSKRNKKQGKRLWFVIKDKVLYTYAASEDVAALESQPLLGFVLKVDPSQKSAFNLYHKKTLYYNFKADDVETAERWINSFKEAMVL